MKKELTLHHLCLGLALLLSVSTCASAQVGLLDIVASNYVFYVNDGVDFNKLALDPTRQPPPVLRTFSNWVGIGDITSVNGDPARGTMTVRGTTLNYNPAAATAAAVSDTTRNFICDFIWEIQQSDGTPVGTITATGVIFGPASPSAPGDSTTGALTITGGTGAYFGVRGQVGVLPIPIQGRATSASEDPSVRRILGGGARRLLLNLIPLDFPQVLANADGPLVVRPADNSLIGLKNPARAGEVLTLYARGLGPLTLPVYPGQVFPSPATPVNGPVGVQVNGVAATVLWAGGYPAANGAYQVNFLVPPGSPSGLAKLLLTLAWMKGAEVSIPISAK